MILETLGYLAVMGGGHLCMVWHCFPCTERRSRYGFFMDKIIQGDCLSVLKTLSSESVDCIVTSPPYYGLRDYGVEGQLGLEKTLTEFVSNMLLITFELKRVLKKTGTMFWNHGDNYSSSPTGSMGNQEKTDGVFSRLYERNRGKNSNTTVRIKMKEIPEKSLSLQAHRLAIRMIDEQGWILRNQIIWHKPNAMPSSVQDRFGVDFEPIFFFTKSKKYHFEKQYEDSGDKTYKPFNMRVRDVKRGKVASDQYKANKGEIEGSDRYGITGSKFKWHSGNFDANGDYIGIPGKRGMRTVWKIPARGFKEAHFATFPEALLEIPIKSGCPRGGVLLDPFMGAGTSAVVAKKLGRQYLGIELNPEYIKIAEKRISGVTSPLF